MPEASVAVRLRVEGAEEVKRQMEDLHNAFNRGEIEFQDYAKGLREVNRDSGTLIKSTQLQTRLYLAQHPSINNLNRAMSTFGSTSRWVLSAVTAISTTLLSITAVNREFAQTTADLQEARRQQALALNKYGFDSEEYAEATETVNMLSSSLDEMTKQRDVNNMTTILLIGGIIGSAAKNVMEMVVAYKVWAGQHALFMAAASAGVTFFALLAAMIAGVAAAIYMVLTPGDQLADFLKMLFPQYSETIDEMSKKTDEFFTQKIPNAFIAFTNWWGYAIANFVNIFVDGLNFLIRKANDAAGALGLPKLKLIQQFQYHPIAYIGANGMQPGGGMSRGAGAGDSVPFARVTRAGGGGNTVINTYVTVQGTVRSDRDLADFIDKTLKEKLKNMGWN